MSGCRTVSLRLWRRDRGDLSEAPPHGRCPPFEVLVGRAELFEAWYGFLLVSGNSYLEVSALSGEPRELHILRPDRIQIVPGADGYPEAYDYSVEGTAPVRLDGEALPNVRRVLHQKLFHPLNDHYGRSPIEAAATAIDIHNSASRWNKALLDNFCGPTRARSAQSG